MREQRGCTLRQPEVDVGMQDKINLAQKLQKEVHMLAIEPTGTSNTGDKAAAAPRKTA